MLGRKQSLRGDVILADYGAEESFSESTDIEWVNKAWVRRFLRICALISLVSICLNTPSTFNKFSYLLYITFICDVMVTIFFSAEMIAKIHIKGLINYCRDRWSVFDAIMVVFHWISVVLHVLEITKIVAKYSYLSCLRAPRPLIMIRFIRVFLKFSMPKSRINQIFKRSSQQIYNVTLFFLFFMTLYGLLGVQLFGVLSHHCVRNGTDPQHLTLNDLAIPDSHCSPDTHYGHQCPEGMICMELDLPKTVSGFSGFDDLAHSFFTVYQAASQEGWSHLMYQAMDSLPAWRAALYFVTMIFFLAWLVKNVFIAVITETFNEIRVQFQQMWGERIAIVSQATPQVLRGDDTGWKLIEIDENQGEGRFRAPKAVRTFIQSAVFQIFIMIGIVIDASFAASVSFEHDGRSREEFYKHYYIAQVIMTIFFDVEVFLKVWCYGFRGYFKRSIHKFELLLAIGTTLHIIPELFLTMLAYFQVLRVVRLIKASPVLEDFVSKIFGPGKKLGSLIVFTMCLLIVTSSISMQLFCSLDRYTKFQAFPEAFMSMFQILTQEGWTEVMNETMLRTRDTIGPLVAIYFILYHLFVSLIVLSLFVAVILDNLELDEDIKKVKQLKAREQSAGISEELPLRLRIFEKFPDSPQMTKLNKVSSEFNVPKVRESFMRCFVDEEEEEESSPSMKKINLDNLVTYRKNYPLRLLSSPSKTRTTNSLFRKVSVNTIVTDSNYQRLLVGDSGQLFIPGKGAKQDVVGGGQKLTRYDGRSIRRSVRGSIKMKHAYDHLKENGGETTESGAATGASARNPHEFDIKLLQRKRQQAEMKRNQREEDLRENHPFFDNPLFFIGRESKFRKLCQIMVYARYDPTVRDPVTGKERKIRYKAIHNLLGLVTYLDWFMIIVTTLSSISMMFERPDYRIMNNPTLQIMEYVFVVSMSIELTLKTFADGLLFTPKALIKDVAGVMDFFIFTVSCVSLCWMPQHVAPSSKEQFLLILRCIRPLRIFNLVPHMKKVVYELCRGFKEILLVSVLLIVLLFVFACYGVHMFGGRLARCNDPTITNRDECVGVFLRKVFVTKMKLQPGESETYPQILVPRIWANPRNFNFDNIFYAMLILFEMLSYEGYNEVRDVIAERVSPIHTIYIHIYVFLGNMIGLTLFVGVVIANYGENRGTALLTVDQRRWCDLKKRLKIAQPLHLPPRPDYNKWRAFFYDITQHIAFKRFIALMVLTNSGLLCVTWDKNAAHTVPLATVSTILTLMFVVEVLIKCIAFTARGYWQSRRNRYDLFVTCCGVVWVVLHFTLMNEVSYSFGFVVAILRFFTITGKHATLKMLMLTVAVSVYKSFFIIMGMFLLIFFYALMGVILFGTVKHGEAIARQANFRTGPQGIITLFRIVTGEDWNKIMHDCMVSPPYCTPGNNYWETDCGNFTFSLIYFCSFYVIITYIVLNLLVAIIMENFSLFYSNEEDALLSYADIRNFQNTWNLVDTQQRGMIPVRKVKFLLRLLKGRLEVDLEKDRLLFKHMVHEMERLHNGEDVTFHDVLNMLSYRSVDIRKSLQLEELMAREELEFLIIEEVAKQTIRQWLDNCLRKIKQQKQQNSLIHSLRATNEPLFMAINREEEGAESGQKETDASGKVEEQQKTSTNVSDENKAAKKMLRLDSMSATMYSATGSQLQQAVVAASSSVTTPSTPTPAASNAAAAALSAKKFLAPDTNVNKKETKEGTKARKMSQNSEMIEMMANDEMLAANGWISVCSSVKKNAAVTNTALPRIGSLVNEVHDWFSLQFTN
ncbi:sodium leak channel non-selective protein-like protein [Dinothrombium tinctorium]|uniref:Sodium leak channel non-selective protein-like protein n=1 Tax=Dinothrombium tinctorium TaxID=1965070 RepID=A0A443R4I8_9ACAR|nr:sodium leak channel non-selective protein-like protein [Dinothrombium tinctorium]